MTNRAQFMAMSRDCSDRAQCGPPEAVEILVAQAALFSTLAERTPTDGSLLFDVLTDAAYRHPATVVRLLATRAEWAAERGVTLPITSAVCEDRGNGEICLTLSGYISSWTSNVLSLVHRIRDADKVTLRIKSPGADIAIAEALHDALVGKDATAEIYFAASGAAVVAAGCRLRKIARNGWLALHSPAMCVCGTAAWLRQTADQADCCSARLPEIFAKATGWPTVATEGWFDGVNDYWFDSSAALQARLAHKIFDPLEESASVKPAPMHEDQDSEAEALAKELLPRLRCLFKDPERFSTILQGLS